MVKLDVGVFGKHLCERRTGVHYGNVQLGSDGGIRGAELHLHVRGALAVLGKSGMTCFVAPCFVQPQLGAVSVDELFELTAGVVKITRIGYGQIALLLNDNNVIFVGIQL